MNLDDLASFYESLAPASIGRIPEFYSADAFFKDPFNEVRGVAAIERIFAHMYDQVQEPRFVVLERIGGASAVLVWEFHYRTRSGHPGVIRGASHLRFGADGKVHYHRDYWDAAEELYMKQPLLGSLMRWLRRRLAA